MPLTQDEWRRRQAQTAAALEAAGVTLTDAERAAVEIADFGLGRFETEGLGLLVYVNTHRCCAKELVMLPGQTCPQHRHPPVDGDPGKEETFRVRRGLCVLYVAAGGAAPETLLCEPPGPHYRPLHEVALHPGEQFTIPPNTWHWFQAGPDGAVISEFSTRSRDEADIFLDPSVQRIPVMEE